MLLFRIQFFDIVRGVAIGLMVSYHICFDLNYFNFTHFSFNYDAFWLSFRALILSLFIGLAGISIALATARRFNPRRYFTRIAKLAICAAFVSIASKMLFPDSWIFFGVLHFILVASILCLAFLRLRRVSLAAGLALLAIGLNVRLPFFDQPWLQWFGLMTYKPITEDYVPLLPWFGVMLVGLFLGRLFLESNSRKKLASWRSDTAPAILLAFAGRNSLLIYMLHQPLLLGLLYGVRMSIHPA